MIHFGVELADADGRYHGDPWKTLAVEIIRRAVVELDLLRGHGAIRRDGTVAHKSGRYLLAAEYRGPECKMLVKWLRGEQVGNEIRMVELLDGLGVNVPASEISAALGLAKGSRRVAVTHYKRMQRSVEQKLGITKGTGDE